MSSFGDTMKSLKLQAPCWVHDIKITGLPKNEVVSRLKKWRLKRKYVRDNNTIWQVYRHCKWWRSDTVPCTGNKQVGVSAGPTSGQPKSIVNINIPCLSQEHRNALGYSFSISTLALVIFLPTELLWFAFQLSHKARVTSLPEQFLKTGIISNTRSNWYSL